LSGLTPGVFFRIKQGHRSFSGEAGIKLCAQAGFYSSGPVSGNVNHLKGRGRIGIGVGLNKIMTIHQKKIEAEIKAAEKTGVEAGLIIPEDFGPEVRVGGREEIEFI